MTTETWANKKIQDEFFDELRALIAKYPHLANRMAEDYDDDPSNEHWSHEGYPRFNPKSPAFLQGIVLILSFTNLEHYEDMYVLDPYEQSSFMSTGLLSRASVNSTVAIGE